MFETMPFEDVDDGQIFLIPSLTAQYTAWRKISTTEAIRVSDHYDYRCFVTDPPETNVHVVEMDQLEQLLITEFENQP